MRSWFWPARTRDTRVREATPEQLAASGASAGSIGGRDPIDGDYGFRPLGLHTREVPEWTHEKARAHSVAAYRMNPLGRAIIDTYVAFCVGDVGVGYQCSNPDVKEVVRQFWEDPANDVAGQQELLLRDLLIMGEACLELDEDTFTGRLRYAPVIVSDISGVSLINNNPLRPDELHFESAGVTRRPPLRVVRVPDGGELREGQALFFRPWRTLSTDIRSMPFLLPILDWLDSYDTVLSNLIDRTSLARYLVWDVTVEGTQQDVDNFIAARGGTAIPRSGSVEIHNQSVTWEPRTVSTGAQEDSIANQSVMTLIAGGTGLAKTWLAEPEGANRATSLGMAEPVRRRVQGVQRVWLGYVTELLRVVVDRAVAAGRLPAQVTSYDEKTGQEFKVPASQTVQVTGPEIAAADSQITAQVLLNLSTGLQNLVNTGALSNKAAKAAAKKAWEDYVGVAYTSDLDETPEEQARAAALRAMATGKAGPPDGGAPAAGTEPGNRPPGDNGQNVPGTATGKGKNGTAEAREAEVEREFYARLELALELREAGVDDPELDRLLEQVQVNQHVPPYEWRHGWVPLGRALAKRYGKKRYGPDGDTKLTHDPDYKATSKPQVQVKNGEKVVTFGAPGTTKPTDTPVKHPSGFGVGDTAEIDGERVTVSKIHHDNAMVKNAAGKTMIVKVEELKPPGSTKPKAKRPFKPKTSFTGLHGPDAYNSVTKAKQIRMTEEEASAIRHYTADGYTSVNGYLRHGVSAPYVTSTIRNLDAVFERVPPTQEQIIVKRGILGAKEIFGPVGSRVGGEFHDKGYVSTTTSEDVRGEFLGGYNDARLEILVPPGSKVLMPDGRGSQGDDERELMLPRGSRFRVRSDEVIDGKREIRLELI